MTLNVDPRPMAHDVLTKSPKPSIAHTAASSNGETKNAAREVRRVVLHPVHGGPLRAVAQTE